jgi:Protein of unknown function (DUF2934)
MRKERNLTTTMAIPGRALGPDTSRPTREEIAALAYELWVARGRPDGTSQADWLDAEQHLKSATPAAKWPRRNPIRTAGLQACCYCFQLYGENL